MCKEEGKNLILTELRNPNTLDIDEVSTLEIVKKINEEDKKVAIAVEKTLPEISQTVDMIAESFLKGGRLLYFGAGTSGRLGVLDASECPPTFGVSSEMVQGFIAGGDSALRNAIEGAEDDFELGKQDVLNSNANQNDVIVAISASGNAKYLLGVLTQAKELEAKTASICCNKNAKMKEISDVFMCAEVGEEAITGSTRMKSGTAQKMILNMLTTSSMIKIGKTYENLMIDLKPTNEKLVDRATRIISELSEATYENSKYKLTECGYNVKTAVLCLKLDISKELAENVLNKHAGKLKSALKDFDIKRDIID